MDDRHRRYVGERRTGWWRQRWRAVTRWFQPDGTRIEGPVTVEVHGDPDDFSFVTPALGEAFEFVVDIRCSWCATGTASGSRRVADVEAELLERIDEAKADVRYGIETKVREVAREFLPHRAGDCERALGRQASTCFSDGDVTCTATPRVRVVEAVRKELERYSLERIALDQRLESTRALIEVIRQLRDAWRQFLDEGLRQLNELGPLRREAWLAPYAVQLAEQPRDVATVLRTMLQERLDHGDELFTRLGGLIQAGQHLDVYDFLLQSDIALRSTLEGLGVPVPPLQHANPFGGDTAPDVVVDITDAPASGDGAMRDTEAGRSDSDPR